VIEPSRERFGCVCMPQLVAATVWLAATALIAFFISIFPEQKRLQGHSVEIVALADGVNTEGSSFLGCGSIEGVSYCFYYKKLPNGGYKQDKIEVENVTIFENDSIPPKIQYYRYEFVNDVWNDWALIPGCSCNVDIFIPYNSIKQNYNLDLK